MSQTHLLIFGVLIEAGSCAKLHSKSPRWKSQARKLRTAAQSLTRTAAARTLVEDSRARGCAVQVQFDEETLGLKLAQLTPGGNDFGLHIF